VQENFKNTFSKLIVGLILFGQINFSFAQDSIRKPLLVGIGAEAYFTLSGAGGYYSPYLAFNRARGTFRIGPVIQKRSLEVNGLKAYFSYRIVSKNQEDLYHMNFAELRPGALQVNIYMFAQYVQNAMLSYKRSVETQLLNIDSAWVNNDWNAVRLNTFQAGVGLELGIKITKRVLWTNYIGLSVYDHTNWFPELYYDRTAVVLMMGSSLTIPTFRYKKHHKGG
jgi:hypothetical protein